MKPKPPGKKQTSTVAAADSGHSPQLTLATSPMTTDIAGGTLTTPRIGGSTRHHQRGRLGCEPPDSAFGAISHGRRRPATLTRCDSYCSPGMLLLAFRSRVARYWLVFN